MLANIKAVNWYDPLALRCGCIFQLAEHMQCQWCVILIEWTLRFHFLSTADKLICSRSHIAINGQNHTFVCDMLDENHTEFICNCYGVSHRTVAPTGPFNPPTYTLLPVRSPTLLGVACHWRFSQECSDQYLLFIIPASTSIRSSRGQSSSVLCPTNPIFFHEFEFG